MRVKYPAMEGVRAGRSPIQTNALNRRECIAVRIALRQLGSIEGIEPHLERWQAVFEAAADETDTVETE